MGRYARIDPALSAWAKASGLKIMTSFADREARFCYWSSSQGECFQIGVEPELLGGVRVDAWSVETLDDRELHRRWSVPLGQLGEALSSALSEIHAWASPTRRLENLLALFSPETSLSLEECAGFIERTRKNPDTREVDALRRELTELYSHDDTNWLELLSRFDLDHVATDQRGAKEFVTHHIWNAVFPEESDRPPQPR